MKIIEIIEQIESGEIDSLDYQQIIIWLTELNEIQDFVNPLRTFDTKNLYIEELKKVVGK